MHTLYIYTLYIYTYIYSLVYTATDFGPDLVHLHSIILVYEWRLPNANSIMINLAALCTNPSLNGMTLTTQCPLPFASMTYRVRFENINGLLSYSSSPISTANFTFNQPDGGIPVLGGLVTLETFALLPSIGEMTQVTLVTSSGVRYTLFGSNVMPSIHPTTKIPRLSRVIPPLPQNIALSNGANHLEISYYIGTSHHIAYSNHSIYIAFPIITGVFPVKATLFIHGEHLDDNLITALDSNQARLSLLPGPNTHPSFTSTTITPTRCENLGGTIRCYLPEKVGSIDWTLYLESIPVVDAPYVIATKYDLVLTYFHVDSITLPTVGGDYTYFINGIGMVDELTLTFGGDTVPFTLMPVSSTLAVMNLPTTIVGVGISANIQLYETYVTRDIPIRPQPVRPSILSITRPINGLNTHGTPSPITITCERCGNGKLPHGVTMHLLIFTHMSPSQPLGPCTPEQIEKTPFDCAMASVQIQPINMQYNPVSHITTIATEMPLGRGERHYPAILISAETDPLRPQLGGNITSPLDDPNPHLLAYKPPVLTSLTGCLPDYPRTYNCSYEAGPMALHGINFGPSYSDNFKHSLLRVSLHRDDGYVPMEVTSINDTTIEFIRPTVTYGGFDVYIRVELDTTMTVIWWLR